MATSPLSSPALDKKFRMPSTPSTFDSAIHFIYDVDLIIVPYSMHVIQLVFFPVILSTGIRLGLNKPALTSDAIPCG